LPLLLLSALPSRDPDAAAAAAAARLVRVGFLVFFFLLFLILLVAAADDVTLEADDGGFLAVEHGLDGAEPDHAQELVQHAAVRGVREEVAQL
jgi:hypothetical protein